MNKNQKTPVNNKQVLQTPTLTWKDKLLPQDYEQLKSVFDLFDQDHSGTIDPTEINKIMNQLGESRMGTFTYALISNLNDKQKPINFNEFLDIVCPKVGEIKTKQGIRTIFNHIDNQQDQAIDFEELKHLAKLDGDGINDDDILEMLHSIHINRETSSNEFIQFEEFYQMVSKYYKS